MDIFSLQIACKNLPAENIKQSWSVVSRWVRFAQQGPSAWLAKFQRGPCNVLSFYFFICLILQKNKRISLICIQGSKHFLNKISGFQVFQNSTKFSYRFFGVHSPIASWIPIDLSWFRLKVLCFGFSSFRVRVMKIFLFSVRRPWDPYQWRWSLCPSFGSGHACNGRPFGCPVWSFGRYSHPRRQRRRPSGWPCYC